jgi:hypothetical protein
MFRLLRHRPSPAMAVALLALFVALGGSAMAAFVVTSNSQIGPDTIYGANKPADANDNIVDGSIMGRDIKPGSIFGSRIADGSLTAADLAPDAVDSTKVLDESLTSSDLASDSVNATEIADSSIDTGEIVDNSLFSQDLAPDSVGSSELATDAVGTAEVANESLTLSDIAGSAVNGSISLNGIANGRCIQVTFNVSGAQVGDSPIVTTRAAIQTGILLYPNRVASAGHVEVNACNFSGTSMTAISGFPVRVITIR